MSLILKWLRIISIGRNPKITLVRIVVLIVVVVVLDMYVLLPIRIDGKSMEPTYHDGSVNFINRLSYLSNQPQRGDVVGIKLAGDHIMYMKRLMGLPGETVSFFEGHVCINGVPQPEPYLKFHSDWNLPPRTLGADEYYFVGDNRSMPEADHTKGISDRNHIVGKVLIGGKY